MSKYIIELDDRIKLVTSVGVTEHGVVYTTSDYVHNLEELNSDYINEHFGQLQDDAYQKGYKDCETRYCSFDACPNRQSEYRRGLDEAWEAAKKIALMDTETSENVTGYFGLFRIMENLTPMQALEKLKAYEEQKADDEIKVGDEVVITDRGTKYIVVSFGEYFKEKTACGFGADGAWYGNEFNKLRKTGRHFDIASILEDMRND